MKNAIIHFVNKTSFQTQTTILIWIIIIGFLLTGSISLLSLQALKTEFDLNAPQNQDIQTLLSLNHFYNAQDYDEKLPKILNMWNEYKAHTLTKNHGSILGGLREWYGCNFMPQTYEQIQKLIPQENALIDIIDQAFIDNDRESIPNYIEEQLMLSFSLSLYQQQITDSIYSHTYSALLVFFCVIVATILILSLSIRQSINTNHHMLEEAIKAKTHELRLLNSNLQKSIEYEVEQNRKKDLIMFQQARLASIGEMIQNIAHQWRQPLNSLMILIQSFKTKGAQNKLDNDFVLQQTEYGMKIATEMSNTIENFRNFFRPESSQECFDVPKSIYNSFDLLKEQLHVSEIEVGIHVSGEAKGLQIQGYQNSFTQAILVVINNAIDALLLKQESLERLLIDVTLDKIGYNVIICVRDNAGGIELKDKTRVFEPYFTTKHQSVGTGVGLYMAKQIIERQFNGTISVKNVQWGAQKEYYGAEFKIQLSIEDKLIEDKLEDKLEDSSRASS